jgi:allophanate hydrolase subunit 2
VIEILSPGVMASVQDMGRPGLRNLGVGSTGAMDARALHIANLLAGNEPGTAGSPSAASACASTRTPSSP